MPKGSRRSANAGIARDGMVQVIRSWATESLGAGILGRVLLFGSIREAGNPEFDPRLSDIDLILGLPRTARTPADLAIASARIADSIRNLEVALTNVASHRSAHRFLVSALPLSDFEMRHSLKKGWRPDFFETTSFVDASDWTEWRPMMDTEACRQFSQRYAALMTLFDGGIQYRYDFIHAAARGKLDDLTWPTRELKTGMTATERRGVCEQVMPKSLERAAAQLDVRSGFEARLGPGAAKVIALVSARAEEGGAYKELSDWLTPRYMQRGERVNLSPRLELLLWELLLGVAARRVLASEGLSGPSNSGRGRRIGGASSEGAPTLDTSGDEVAFIKACLDPSLRIGGLDLRCKALPIDLLDLPAERRAFFDAPEEDSRIALEWIDSPLPLDILSRLTDEIEQRLRNVNLDGDEFDRLTFVKSELRRGGSNPYPRIVGLPKIVGGLDAATRGLTLLVPVSRSRYGVALVQEKKLDLPTARVLRDTRVLNSLAVRVAYTFRRGSEWWCEFHQRRAGRNATYQEAWDIGAAGYINQLSEKHRDPEAPDITSPWRAAASEIAEELGLPPEELPNREHYVFFGLGRNDPTGQLDLLGLCRGIYVPPTDRATTARVMAFDRCPLTPAAAAAFLEEKGRWVPTAILTLILTLEHIGFARHEIDARFGALGGKLVLEP